MNASLKNRIFGSALNRYYLLVNIVLLTMGSALGAAESGVLSVFAKGSPSVYLEVSTEPNALPAQCASTLDDLRRCFQAMTGVPLPDKAQPGLVPIRMKLLPAEDRATPKLFGLQGYEIAVQPDGITLSAPTALGLVNAGMHLLDAWGCRWIMPGEIGEVIPHRTTLTLPLGTKRHQVSADSRINTGILKGNGENEWGAWIRRNRMATQQWMTGQHYYSYAIPPEKYFKEHPEYYALIGGKRVPTQLCTTNPDVIALMIEKAKAWLKERPEVDSFPMDPNDNFDFCQCDRCVAQDPPGTTAQGLPLMTDRAIHFANEVARAIRADFPDKVVALYAYSNHTLPPVRVKPESNLAIYLCRFSYCLLHLTPCSQCSSPGEFFALIKAWKALVPRLYLYEYFPIYWTGNLPCPNYLDFAASVKKTYQMGVMGSHEDSSFTFSNNTFINDYMATRLKGNSDLDPQEVLTDLCDGFFGPARKPMRAYYQAMAEVVKFTHPGRAYMGGALRKYDEMFSPKIVTRARAALTEALALVKEGTMERRRVEMVEVGHRYLEAYLEGIAQAKLGKYEESAAAFDRAEQLIDRLNPKGFGYSDAADCHRRIRGARLKFLAEYCPEKLRMVRRWSLLGPLNNDTRDADLTQDGFEPGQGIGRDVKLKDGRVVAWAKYESPGGFLNFREAFAKSAHAWRLSYAYAAFTVKAPGGSAQLRMDSFYPFRVYLNGAEVYYRPGCDADAPDKRIVDVELKEGENTLVFKCCQTVDSSASDEFPWGLYMRITDRRGNPIEELVYP
jgi:hypothetical protein